MIDWLMNHVDYSANFKYQHKIKIVFYFGKSANKKQFFYFKY